MTLYEVTKLAISIETSYTEMVSLSERIDIMFLIGNKFDAVEYLELSDLAAAKLKELGGDTEPEETEVIEGASEPEETEETAEVTE